MPVQYAVCNYNLFVNWNNYYKYSIENVQVETFSKSLKKYFV